MNDSLGEGETIQQKFSSLSGGERFQSSRGRKDSVMIPKEGSNQGSLPKF
jgi:hypothetical protein